MATLILMGGGLLYYFVLGLFITEHGISGVFLMLNFGFYAVGTTLNVILFVLNILGLFLDKKYAKRYVIIMVLSILWFFYCIWSLHNAVMP